MAKTVVIVDVALERKSERQGHCAKGGAHAVSKAAGATADIAINGHPLAQLLLLVRLCHWL